MCLLNSIHMVIISKQFEFFWLKYNKIISIKELALFSNQLAKSGYRFRIKNYSIVYEKPTLKDLFLRFKSLINGKRLYLHNYQRYIYKI